MSQDDQDLWLPATKLGYAQLYFSLFLIASIGVGGNVAAHTLLQSVTL
jgi:hypothetical protein